jgi:ADP-dependent NAD(P)H-hydrate dehydratase / NAD(P)H-hydrate epimerase
VIDASGLNAFPGRLAEINRHRRPRAITPHPGELGRLLGRSASDVERDRIGAVREAARAGACIAVLKGHHTLIADPEGRVAVNPTGNPGMATGGMGDVLSGLIAAFMARGVDPFNAACAGVYLHGLAGDILKDERADIGLAAMEVADAIPRAIASLR